METGLWPYSPQLGIYGPRQPLIAVPNIPNPKQGREWSLQVSLFLVIPFLTVLRVVPAMPFHGGKEVPAPALFHIWWVKAGPGKKELLIPGPGA